MKTLSPEPGGFVLGQLKSRITFLAYVGCDNWRFLLSPLEVSLAAVGLLKLLNSFIIASDTLEPFKIA